MVYPIYCYICSTKLKTNVGLCEACWKKVKHRLPPFCIKCGKVLAGPKGLNIICGDCQNNRLYFEHARSCCYYEGILKEVIHLLKFQRKFPLIDRLDEIMVKFILNNQILYSEIDLLIPVPAHKKRLKERGIDQVSLLAERLSRAIKIKLERNNLKRIKYTTLQTDLSREGRVKNVSDAFIVKGPKRLMNKSILLIDDLFTTGSTVNECAKILINSGVKKVEVLTLARGDTLL